MDLIYTIIAGIVSFFIATSPTPVVSPMSTNISSPIITNFYITSDSSWKYSGIEISGWKDIGFDDNNWLTAKSPSTGLCGGIDVILPQGRIAPPMSAQNPVAHSTMYFRKTFNVSSPSTGKARVVFDDDGEVYINGRMVLQSVNSGYIKDILMADECYFYPKYRYSRRMSACSI